MTRPGPLLILTMPGFGIETLRHLVALPGWPAAGVQVALVGQRPPAWRQAAAWARRSAQRRQDRLHPLAESTLCAGPAERFLREQGFPLCWLGTDDEVRLHRLAVRPALTLTITSRILFSACTLADPESDWFNVHPGLLPEYAGATPAPYMFLDGVGGCTIHRMAARVDAGAVLDRAPMSGPLAPDGGTYFFEQLPAHTAGRVSALLGHWVSRQGWPPLGAASPVGLHHCSSRRLAADRQLDWTWPAERLVRWVRALAGMAPGWWADGRGRQVEVTAAEPGSTVAVGQPGLVRSRHGRGVEVACGGGSVVLRCRARSAVQAGQCLPLVLQKGRA